MSKQTTLTLTCEQIERLLDGMESLIEPLPVAADQSIDESEHQALLCRLRTALTRVQNEFTSSH